MSNNKLLFSKQPRWQNNFSGNKKRFRHFLFWEEKHPAGARAYDSQPTTPAFQFRT